MPLSLARSSPRLQLQVRRRSSSSRMMAKRCGRDDGWSTLRNALCTCIVMSATVFATIWISIGATPKGKSWYSHLSKKVFSDYKAGLPIMTMAFPLLVASSICYLLHVASKPLGNNKNNSSNNGGGSSGSAAFQPLTPSPLAVSDIDENEVLRRRPKQSLLSKIQAWWRGWCRTGYDGGDANFRSLGIVLVLIPCGCYLMANLYRRLYGKVHTMSTDDLLMGIGNSFGLMSVVALSWFLIPVSKHSIFLNIMGWHPMSAVRLHIWLGRIGIFGGIIHGVFHTLRWIVTSESLWTMFVPPRGCWTWDNSSDVQPSCLNDDTECTCYYIFRNLTGLITALAMSIIFVTSVGWVRNISYRLFYWCHIIFGPVMILMALMHWNKMVVYICPSILYYLASSVPTLIQSIYSSRQGGVHVVRYQHIPNSGNCLELSFDPSIDAMEALWESFPSPYVKICVPDISPLWHPFTVISSSLVNNNGGGGGVVVVPRSCGGAAAAGGPMTSSFNNTNGCADGDNDDNGVVGEPSSYTTTNDDDDVTLIFRATGPFTNELSNRLRACTTNMSRPPKILVDGFHGGGGNRLASALRHDHVVMIAGGIGITPFLSFMPLLHGILLDRCKFGGLPLMSTSSEAAAVVETRDVTLHWICRDEGLIHHVVSKYLSSLLDEETGGYYGSASEDGDLNFIFRVVIHHTGGGGSGRSSRRDYRDTPPSQDATAAAAGGPEEESSSDVDVGVDIVNSYPCGTKMIPSTFAPRGKRNLLKNIPSFVLFTILAWMGLWVFWYFYTNFQSKKGIMSRAWSLPIVVLLCFVISILAVAASERLLFSSRSTLLLGMKRVARNQLALRMEKDRMSPAAMQDGMEGVDAAWKEDAPFSIEEEEEDGPQTNSADGGGGVIEMTKNKSTSSSPSSSATHGRQENVVASHPHQSRSVSIEHRNGRPSIENDLVGPLRSSSVDSPGIFVCGPNALMSGVKASAWRNVVQCGCTHKRNIALYEDRFGP